MNQMHPSEEQLLLFADGERSELVTAHLDACAACRQAVAELQTGRDALRAAPLLEFPAARREAVLAGLPARDRRLPRRRFLGVVVPLAAVAAVVAVVGLTGRTDPERTAEQLAAEAQRDAAPAEVEAPAAAEEAERPPAADEALLRSVEGPAEDVAELLRARGLDARVVDGTVEVRGASRGTVEDALRGRPDGDVEVFVR